MVSTLLILTGCGRMQLISSFMTPQSPRRAPRVSSERFTGQSDAYQLPILIKQRLVPLNVFRRRADLFVKQANEQLVEAEDFEALQVLFSEYCDKEGLMTKMAVMEIPAIAELLVRRRNFVSTED